MRPIVGLVFVFALGDGIGLRLGNGFLAATCLVTAALVFGIQRKTVAAAPEQAAGTARGAQPGATAARPQPALLIAFLFCGLGSGARYAAQANTDCRTRLPDGARLSGTAVIDGLASPGARVVLDLERLRVNGHAIDCRLAVRATLPGRASWRASGAAPIRPGSANIDHVVFEGSWWRSTDTGPWPAPPERAGMAAVRTLTPLPISHTHPLLRTRNRALRAVHRRFGVEAGMAESLLLARRENLDPTVRREFAAAGLAHLLAISGAHVGILAAIVMLLARLGGLGPRAAAATSAAVATLYVGFLGAPAAAMRAAVQTLALLASRLLQRPADPFGVLSVAALCILAATPRALLDPGFQLSFAGIFGLISFTPSAAKLLPGGLPGPLRRSLAQTLAATVATAPIAALHFGLVSTVGPLSNLAAAPVLGLAVPAMGLSLVAGMFSDGLAGFLGGGAQLLLAALRGIGHVMARVPFGSFWVSSDMVTLALAATAIAVVLGPHAWSPDDGPRRRGRARRWRMLRAATGVAAFVTLPIAGRTSGRLEIHAIDVGQGDAFAVRTPHDRWLLIDTGPLSERFDAGRDRVAPYLRRLGVRRIEFILLTHPHADHIGGVASLWHAFDVGAVIDPAVPADETVYMDVVRQAAAGHWHWLEGRAGRELRLDDVTIDLLSPDDSLLDDLDDPNDYSIVLRLEYGRFAALFLGDAPRAVENRLVERYGEGLAAQVLKVGHHGSRTSTGDSLLDAARPGVALVSVGRRNRYGHPNPDVMHRLTRHGVRIVRTDLDGSVVVRAHADGSSELLRVR